MRTCRRAIQAVVGAIVWTGMWGVPAYTADFATDNFTVTAPTREIAQQVGEAAEYFRREIARDWLGYELPRWYAKCPIRVKVGQIGAGGQTTFNFHPTKNGRDEVCDWNMQIQGSLERILDSVLPHEVSHTIFACHFRRPLPRWADEGAATLVEHESERRRQVLTVEQVINTRNRIPLKDLLAMKEYPSDMKNVMTLYAEGYSLAHLLVQEGGKARYLEFLEDAHQRNWDKAVKKHYRYADVATLEKRWKEWVLAGSPEIDRNPDQLYVKETGRGRNPSAEAGATVRGQSPTEPSNAPPATARPATQLADARQAVGGAESRTASLEAPAPRRRSRAGARLNDDTRDETAELVASSTRPAARQLPEESDSSRAGAKRRPGNHSTAGRDEKTIAASESARPAPARAFED
ncbi:MAG: hypothetical protein EHM42_11985, partial [Planctomycetaceae bacterium]